MNPYTFKFPTEIILYLIGILKMYDNPISCKSIDNFNYVILDMKQFNPLQKHPKQRYLLYVLNNDTNQIDFYNVNLGFNDTLISLERATNHLTIIAQTERVQNFFTFQSNTHDFFFNLDNINQLRDYKVGISNLINLPGPIYIINNNFLLSFITFYDASFKKYNTIFILTAYYNPMTNHWDTTRIKYLISNGTIIGSIDLKPIFSVNFKKIMLFNNVYYLDYQPGIDNILIGGPTTFHYRMESDVTAFICPINELQYQNPMNSFELLEYYPLNQYYILICLVIYQGTQYNLFGFSGTNSSPENFYTILQASVYVQKFQTMFYTLIRSKYSDHILIETPLLQIDGLIIWLDEKTQSFIIYQPTFNEFLQNNTLNQLGVQDLVY
jgi:hypothetical protein